MASEYTQLPTDTQNTTKLATQLRSVAKALVPWSLPLYSFLHSYIILINSAHSPVLTNFHYFVTKDWQMVFFSVILISLIIH